MVEERTGGKPFARPTPDAAIVNNVNVVAGYVIDLGDGAPAGPIDDVTPEPT